VITETEAYAGAGDKASHASGGRRTARNEPMYGQGGVAYVYLCYGIHHLFNVVTNREGTPHAVLVRAVHPLEGIDVMVQRRGRVRFSTGGPGTLSQALGIHTSQSGTDLLGTRIWIEDRGIVVPQKEVIVGPRVGVDYAGEDALLPYRFRIAPSQLRFPQA
jgi:DNA-3-methyladenine glycosylase